MSRLRTSVLMAAGVVVGSLAGTAAFAAPITWVGGGGDGLWSNGENWDASAAPSPDDALLFAGSNQTGTFNDLAAGTRFDSINFNFGASPFNLTGNGLTLSDGGFVRSQSFQNQFVSLDIAAEGELTLHSDFGLLQFQGNISGNDTLRKTGGGFVVFAGADYTGFTGTLSIEQGQLALVTPLGGDVVLSDGELQIFGDAVVAEGRTFTLAGGTLTVSSAGLTLPAMTDLTGDVIVTGGNGRTFEVTGPFEVQGDHALEITTRTDLRLANLVSDQAGRTLTKNGDGRLTIAGPSRGFGGAIDVNDGTLIVTGELGADVTVNDGGILRGTDGFSPGNGTIVGDVVINDDGQLGVSYVVIDDTIETQGINVEGSVSLQDDSLLSISGAGSIAVGDRFVAITTTNGVDDLGVNLRPRAEFLDWRGAVEGNHYVLTIEQGTIFESGARGSNNQALARAIDTLPFTGVDSGQQSLLNELDELLDEDVDAYNRALRHLAPEQVQAAPSAAVQVAQNMQRTFSTRMAQQRLGIVHAPGRGSAPTSPALAGGLSLASAQLSPATLGHVIGMIQQPRPEIHPDLTTRDFAHEWQVDIQTFGRHQSQDRTADRVGYRGRTGGFVLSVDRSLSPTWRVGMNASYAHTNFQFGDARGSGYVDHLRTGPYASYASGPWFVDAALSVGYHHSTLARGVQVGGASLNANSTSHNFDLAAYLGGGYDVEISRNVTLTPLASLDYLYYYQGSFSESGAGPASLHVDSNANDALNVSLGARLTHIIALGDTTVIPEYAAGYRYAVLNEHQTTARLVGSPTSFTVTNDLASEHTFLVGAGASALIGESTAVYGHIQSEIASDDISHLFNVGLQFRF